MELTCIMRLLFELYYLNPACILYFLMTPEPLLAPVFVRTTLFAAAELFKIESWRAFDGPGPTEDLAPPDEVLLDKADYCYPCLLLATLR